MNVLCIIPARAGSKGLPGKNIAYFSGRPLIQWPILYVLKSKLDCDVLVYTDGADIADAANELGDFCPFMRLKDISSDTTSTEDTLLNGLEDMERYSDKSYDAVLFLTCTEIFRDPDWILDGFDLFLKNDLESVFVVEPTYKNFWSYSPKSVCSRLDPKMKVHGNRQQKTPLYQENSGLLCFTRSDVLRSGYRIGDNVGLIENKTVPYNADIHVQVDLDYAKLLLNFYEKHDHRISQIYNEFGTLD